MNKWTLDKYQSKNLLAKSEAYGSTSLKEHLNQVASCISSLADHFGKSKELAIKGAYLHDIGKAHPVYQAFVHGFREGDARYRSLPHRHELSSLAFLPLFKRQNWSMLTEMVVSHHKSIKHDIRLRGFIDIVNQEGLTGLFESHLQDWETWSPRAIDTLDDLGLKVRKVGLQEAKRALKWSLEYVESLGDGWSAWKGLLMSADHMASALEEDLKLFLNQMFRKPEFTSWHEPNKLYPLSQKDTSDNRRHTLVLAPTGAGKTDFLLKRCRNRIFYILPFQASINAMYRRIQEMTSDETDIRLLHSASKLVADDISKQEVQLQPFVGASVKVLTPHQISNIVFGTMGFESILLDLEGCDVILDEIHTYRAENQAMVVKLVRVLKDLDCRIHIGTATMPTVLRRTLLELLGGSEYVYEVELTNSELRSYDRHIIQKHPSFTEIPSIVEQAVQDQEKVLIVCNTVAKAQEIFVDLSSHYQELPSMLIHSRFRRKDRKEREEELQTVYNQKQGPCLVVSTQVVEVSLDISFDRLVTQAAPIDSLVQRFGRINRNRRSLAEHEVRPIHIIAPEECTLPYNKELVQKSFDILPDNEVLLTTKIQSYIDKVYPDIDIQEIGGYVKWQDGRFQMEKLRHIGEPILMKYLDISSVSCILERDRKKYEKTSWSERQWLEIPVSEMSLYHVKEGLLRAQGGSEPYVLPEQSDYDKLGLVIKKPSNFL